MPLAASMAKARVTYRRCFNDGLQHDPKMTGKLVVAVDVGADGHATGATIETNTGLSKAVADCVVAGARALAFPPPDAGAVTVEMPVNFTQQQ